MRIPFISKLLERARIAEKRVEDAKHKIEVLQRVHAEIYADALTQKEYYHRKLRESQIQITQLERQLEGRPGQIRPIPIAPRHHEREQGLHIQDIPPHPSENDFILSPWKNPALPERKLE